MCRKEIKKEYDGNSRGLMDMWMDGYLDVYRGTVHCSILYLYIVEDNATCVENAEWRGGGDGGVRLWMG